MRTTVTVAFGLVRGVVETKLDSRKIAKRSTAIVKKLKKK